MNKNSKHDIPGMKVYLLKEPSHVLPRISDGIRQDNGDKTHIQYPDGCIFNGTLDHEGNYESGTLSFPNGSYYCGSFGQESCLDPSETYNSERGESENVPSGHGTYVHIHKNEPQQRFSGDWNNGISSTSRDGNGLGVTIYQDRDVRIGNLKHYDFHGECTIYKLSENKVENQIATDGEFQTISTHNYR